MEELGLIKAAGVEITPAGSLYLERLSDTLHKVKKYRMNLADGTIRELTYKEYMVISAGVVKGTAKFVKLHDGELIATHQIRSIKPYEVIIDSRKEAL